MTRARDLADLASSGVIEGTEVADDAITYAKIQNVSADERILGRVSGANGVVEELTKAQMLTMMNVADGSNAYTHPNHSGEVTSTNDGATVIVDNIVDEANLKVSNAPTNGYMLTSQSGASGGLTWATAPSLRPQAKPFFVNSNMQIYQRGYNFAGVTGGNTKYSADRWRFNVGNIGTYEMNNTQVTTGGAYNDGFRQCARIDCTTADGSPAAGDYFYFEYVAEAQDCLAWKKGTTSATTMTLSFWVKSNKTGTAQVNLKDSDNDRMVSATYSISSANTWEKKVVTFPMETSNAMNNDNGAGFVFEWWLGAGTTYSSGTAPTSWEGRTDADRGANNLSINDNTANDWSITGIQAEVGSYTSSNIPSYEWESYGDNLLRCQRYYQLVQDFRGGTVNGTTAYINATFWRTMRTTPTATTTGVLNLNDISADFTQSSGQVTLHGANADGFFGGIGNFTGMTLNRPATSRFSNANKLAFESEL